MNLEQRFTPRAKKLIALAGRVATDWKHAYIGTEHILAAMCRMDGIAARMVETAGITEQMVYSEVGGEPAQPQRPESAELLRAIENLTAAVIRLTETKGAA